MLAGRTAVITGSSKGWGRAIAEGLAACGVRVVVNGRSEEVHRVVSQIESDGGQAVAARVRSDTEDGVDELVSLVLSSFGTLDIWANSLGLMRPEPLLSMHQASWEETLRVQLTSVFLGTRGAARHMVDQGAGGRILNVVGGAAFGSPGASAHAASKGAALAATYSWAEELRPYNITVNAIRGGVASPGMRVFMDRMGLLGAEAEADPAELRKLGFYSRAEASPLAVWLSTDAAADLSGWYIGIDGPRILVYGRVFTELEQHEDEGRSADLLERVLHPKLRELAPRARSGESQRRPADGTTPRFDERPSGHGSR